MPEASSEQIKKVIIILGAPGAGKGTQAELLSDKLGYYSFETSKILEETFRQAKEGDCIKVGDQSYSLAAEKKLWQTGVLMSPPLVAFLVRNKIEELFNDGKSLVMSGSPRTVTEGQELVPFLKKLYGEKNIKVIVLKITAKDTIWRNTRRRICELMRHPMIYSKETSSLTHCPIDGSKLVKREGLDDPKSIRVRLKEYAKRTLPLIALLKKEGFRVHIVDGQGSVEAVFKGVLKALK